MARAQAEAREVMEQTERGKQRMLEFAKELENMPYDEPCFSEEDRARWRHFKNKFSGYIRWIADDNCWRLLMSPSDDARCSILSGSIPMCHLYFRREGDK